jgi:hypothetical protein
VRIEIERNQVEGAPLNTKMYFIVFKEQSGIGRPLPYLPGPFSRERFGANVVGHCVNGTRLFTFMSAGRRLS